MACLPAVGRQKKRHTSATVVWQSYDTFGEVEFEYVEDHEAVAKYGIVNKDVKALVVTARSSTGWVSGC